FLKIFAVWIIEDDLPFTTSETPSIEHLFAFLHTCFLLPSDTTMRKALAEMYIDMYELIKGELISVATNTWMTCSMTFMFAGMIANRITSDWELVERVLDFHAIEDKEHEG
ncbi:hypothetical protein B0H10DRAFT_1711661, partial [Mycena sp. CBHHK59/15]